MRILAIRGENLASLGQPFVIDFEAEPLAGTGLFAITGETGSGKSTILDALCLALYGRYPRFAETQQDTSPDPGGKVKILDGSTILRRGAGKGYAEVDFIGQDNLRYRARWGARRARNKADGAIQSAVRSLHSFSGEIITSVATSKTEVQDAITLRTGLTFDQFRRTVLLAQGDFDSFLLAPERERGELLEKITGTEIYGRISIRVAEGTRMLRLEAEALELQLVSLGLLSSEDREALAQTIHVLQQTVATKTNEGQAIQSRIHHVDNLTRARASLDAAEENLRTARVTSGDAGEERARLAELRAVEPLRSLRNRLAAALGQQAPAKQRAATAQGTLLQAQTAARTTKETLDSSRSAHNSTEAIFKDFGPVWDEAARLDSEFSTAHTETENSRSDAQVARGAVNTMDAELEAIKELIQHTNSALETVTAELAERSHQFTLADRLADLVGGRKTDAGALPHAAALELQAQLQKEQLFKDQPPVGSGCGGLQLGKIGPFGRKMNLAQRSLAVGQVEPGQHLPRQALRHRAAYPFEQVEDRLALPARGQPRPAQRLIDRRDAADFEQPRLGVVAGVGKDFELRLDHLEVAGRPRGLDLSVHSHRLPGVEFPIQIGTIEPDAFEGQAALPHGQLEDGRLAGAQQDRTAHLGDHTGHFARLQFVQAARVLAILIAEGQVVEQVLGGLDALEGEHLRHLGSNALHIHHGSIEGGHTSDATCRTSGGTNPAGRLMNWVMALLILPEGAGAFRLLNAGLQSKWLQPRAFGRE